MRIALNSGFSRRQVADDRGAGLSTLNKWGNAHRETDVVSAEDDELARDPYPQGGGGHPIQRQGGSENDPGDRFPDGQFFAPPKP